MHLLATRWRLYSKKNAALLKVMAWRAMALTNRCLVCSLNVRAPSKSLVYLAGCKSLSGKG
jgi:hypothetical protein